MRLSPCRVASNPFLSGIVGHLLACLVVAEVYPAIVSLHLAPALANGTRKESLVCCGGHARRWWWGGRKYGREYERERREPEYGREYERRGRV